MGLTVISVSYPFAAVTADPVGGAEQVVAQLDRALTAAGHRSIVIAPEGSRTAGELRVIPAVADQVTEAERNSIHRAVRKRLLEAMSKDAPDVIHLHGIDFYSYLPLPGSAAMVTLHLPLAWYPLDALMPRRPNTWLHPVSHSQAREAPAAVELSEPIENGVELAPVEERKQNFALSLGRICPEKGVEDALKASVRAGVPLLIAGKVFPYREHQRYFQTKILPGLDQTRRWIGAVAGRRKRKLLARAKCLLVPSKAPETSSLVSMEALAMGTPVIAYRIGALTDIVEHGRTGYIVDSTDEMSEAIMAADQIDPEECRRRARTRFPLERMTSAYLKRYCELARK
jgi:glycosyltransferase involved in cell wall biosynthesis